METSSPDLRPLPERLGEYLVSRGKIDRTALQRAERLQRETHEKFPVIFSKLGLVSEQDVAVALRDLTGLPLLARADYAETAIRSDRISPKFLRTARVVPVEETDKGLLLAMADPGELETISSLELTTGVSITPVIGVPSDIDEAISRLYEGGAQAAPKDTSEELSTKSDLERLKDIASEAPVIRLVQRLIEQAVLRKASDIHIEPTANALHVRYRIDGALIDVEDPPLHLRPAITSRIKILARLDIAEQRLPQDGRVRLTIRGNEVDFRVSSVPTVHGERIVMRVLDRSIVNLDFKALGFGKEVLEPFLNLLDRPNGIVLVTGPTGSGKTTSLYAALSHLNKPERNILTVEDPVEFELSGIAQVSIKPDIGLTFAHVLRSFLRQDPDIIMVGEMRDLETAHIAVQAALTGHLVLSTVHTNSAAATLTRLTDMGIEDYLLSATINGVVAQRLIRVLCPACKKPYEPFPALLEQLGIEEELTRKKSTLYRPQGCEECNHTGFQGRTTIAEVMTVTDTIRSLVLRGASAKEIHDAAVEEGMISLYRHGMRKVAAGVTSIEEVLRVAEST